MAACTASAAILVKAFKFSGHEGAVGSARSNAGDLRLPSLVASPRTRRATRSYQSPSALFDRGDGTGEGDEKKPGKKKFITKEEEPEQYWQAADEREGRNPMTTPLPYIMILSIASPFLILAVAFANNWIKIPVR